VPSFVAGFTQSVLDAVFGVGPPLDQDPLPGPAPVGRRFLLLHDDPPSMSDGEQRWRAGAAGGCSWAGLAGAGLRRALLQGLQAGAASQTVFVGDVVRCVGQECQGYRVTVSTAQHSTAQRSTVQHSTAQLVLVPEAAHASVARQRAHHVPDTVSRPEASLHVVPPSLQGASPGETRTTPIPAAEAEQIARCVDGC
jgi:hypothetical protein